MNRALIRVVLSGLAFGLVLMRCGTCAFDMAVPSSDIEQRALLRGLERRIDGSEQTKMRAIFPEGGLFTLSFTGFALVDMATAHPDDEALRAHARDELVLLLEKSEAERDVAPFSAWRRAPLPGDARWRGVILEGHQNLLRAGYVVVGGDDVDIIRAYHATSAKLFAMFMASPAGALESFAHRTWYVDNAVALESLRLHDVIYGSNYAPALERFRAKVRAHRDPRSQMPASEISLDDARVLEGPRGCALSWLFAFQPDNVTWSRYRRAWSVDEMGMVGLREYPPWRRGAMDVDSGPIVDGIGAAASAFGVAAARSNHDGDTLARMELPLTLLTAPALTLHGDEELFAGQLVLADALSLWARTVRPWDAPVDDDVVRAPAPLLPLAIAEALALLPVLLAGLVLRASLLRWLAATAPHAR